jgi:hypothetical protein
MLHEINKPLLDVIAEPWQLMMGVAEAVQQPEIHRLQVPATHKLQHLEILALQDLIARRLQQAHPTNLLMRVTQSEHHPKVPPAPLRPMLIKQTKVNKKT